MPEDKKRDPMPSPDATPEEIGEFWDTHSLADYWEETHEAEFQVNLKPEQNQELSDEKKPGLPATTENASNVVLDIATDLALDSAIPAPIRRNALKAFDRLYSALIDVPVGALERRSAEKRAESEARIKIREEITTQITQQMKVDPEYARRAGHKFAEKIIGEQLNLDKISAIAANEIREDKPNSSTSQSTNEPNKKQSAGSTNQDTSSSEEKAISDVWLNIFETEARPQSIEEGQLLFGRILAGEIKQPGTYSMRTLKNLGELDQNIAALFKNLCSTCIFLEHPIDKHLIDVRVPSLGGDPGANALKKYGLFFNRLNILNEYGLIIPEYNSRVDYQVSIADEDYRVIAPFQHQGRYWALLPSPEREKSEEFRVSGVALSRVGRELFYVVDQDPMEQYTEDLKEFFMEQNLQMVEVPSSGPVVLKGIV